MYKPRDTDVSGRNYQNEMRDMLGVLLAAYEVRFAANIAPALIKEFNDMLEFAGGTVVGAEDRGQAVVAYVKHHYTGAPKPTWYANLTSN